MLRMNFPRRVELRQKQAKERQEAWAKLTPQEQLAHLDKRPGESKRQRERLAKALAAPKVVESPAAPAPTQDKPKKQRRQKRAEKRGAK